MMLVLNPKVKIIACYDCEVMENKINEFIKDKRVYDIKYSAYPCGLTAMIMYNEKV